MEVKHTKWVKHIELRPEETVENLDKEIKEFFGMLFTYDVGPNVGERAITNMGGKRFALCGFISKTFCEEYLAYREGFTGIKTEKERNRGK